MACPTGTTPGRPPLRLHICVLLLGTIQMAFRHGMVRRDWPLCQPVLIMRQLDWEVPVCSIILNLRAMELLRPIVHKLLNRALTTMSGAFMLVATTGLGKQVLEP